MIKRYTVTGENASDTGEYILVSDHFGHIKHLQDCIDAQKIADDILTEELVVAKRRIRQLERQLR